MSFREGFWHPVAVLVLGSVFLVTTLGVVFDHFYEAHRHQRRLEASARVVQAGHQEPEQEMTLQYYRTVILSLQQQLDECRAGR